MRGLRRETLVCAVSGAACSTRHLEFYSSADGFQPPRDGEFGVVVDELFDVLRPRRGLPRLVENAASAKFSWEFCKIGASPGFF
jgi:hypothetical protein